MQSHHIIQDYWAKQWTKENKNISNDLDKYRRNNAPGILLRTGSDGGAHTYITNSQNTRRRNNGLESSIENEFRESYKELISAGIDEKTAQKAINKAYKYFDSLGVFN